MSGPARPRVRPGLRRFAIAAFALLLPIAAHALWDHLEVRRLAREIVRIRDRGEPVTDRDLGPTAPQTAEQKSAARLHLAAAAAVVPLYEIDKTLTGDLQKASTGRFDDGAVREGFVRRLEAVLAANGDALALLDKATPLDFVQFGPGTEYSYRTASVWALSAVNEVRGYHLCLTGRADAAADAAMTGLRLLRVDRARSWWLAGMWPGVRVVTFMLSHCPPSPEALARLQRQAEASLPAATVAETLTRAAMADRAATLGRIWFYYGSDAHAPESVSFRNFPLEQVLVRPWLTHLAVGELRDRADVIEALKLPAGARRDAIDQLQRRQRRALTGPFRAGMILSRVATDVSNMTGSYALSQASIAAIAVERYRRDHDGRPPAALAALVPQYLASVPLDPFTDAPLRYQGDERESVVYSVGPDGKDDDGDVNPGPPRWQSGQPAPPKDLGVLVTRRRPQ